MFDSVKNAFHRCMGGVSRRELFLRGGLASMLPALLRSPRPAFAAPAATAGRLQLGPEI